MKYPDELEVDNTHGDIVDLVAINIITGDSNKRGVSKSLKNCRVVNCNHLFNYNTSVETVINMLVEHKDGPIYIKCPEFDLDEPSQCRFLELIFALLYTHQCQLFNEYQLFIETNSMVVITKLRTMIYNRVIKPHSINFIHFNDDDVDQISFDENGRGYDRPEGFCDTYGGLLDVLLM